MATEKTELDVERETLVELLNIVSELNDEVEVLRQTIEKLTELLSSIVKEAKEDAREN